MKDITAVGRISAVYPDNKTAKVYREDLEIVTGNLRILDRGDNWIPSVGDYVVCLFLKQGASNGFILGKY